MILMLPLIFVQFLKDSMLVALMDMVLVSCPVPSPLHTAEKKIQKTAAFIVELTFFFFCKVKLLSISHLFMYFIHFSRRTSGIKWEYTLIRCNKSHLRAHMDKNFAVSLMCTNLDSGKRPTQTQGEHTGHKLYT